MQTIDKNNPFCMSLASNQREIWFDQKVYPDSPLYNIGGYLRIDGHVDFELLQQAIRRLIQESESLRISIKEESNEVFQCVLPDVPYTLECIDFSHVKKADTFAINWINTQFQHPFAIDENSLLWRFALLKVNSQCFFFMTQYHHLTADGWTTKVVIDRLTELYNASIENRQASPASNLNYSDYVSQEQEYLKSKAFHRDQAYWLDLVPSLYPPIIEPAQTTSQIPKAITHRFLLRHDFYNQLKNFSKNYNVASYHVILSALIIYVFRIYGRDEIIFGIPSLNRSGARYKDVLGLFMSLSPLPIDLTADCHVDELLAMCSVSLKNNYRHQRFPLREINKRLGMMQQHRNSLFDIIVSYEKQDYSTLFGGAPVSAHQQFSGVARYPLGVTICEFNESHDVEFILEGAQNIFDAQALERLELGLKSIIEQMISKPQQQLSEINLLSQSETKFLLKTFNTSQNLTVFSESIIGLFQKQVHLNRQSIAIESAHHRLTFEQLDQQSNQLAHYLMEVFLFEKGQKHEQIIAISLSRSVEMIVALLAILKTGSAYLPIDPDTPNKRIQQMLEQSKALALICREESQRDFSALGANLVILDKIQEQVKQQSVESTHLILQENDLAYVIFTSGTSGQPKGVLLEHGALSRRLIGLAKLFGIQHGDRIGQTVQFNFDPSIIEIFLPLIHGGCLILAPERHQTPDEMARFVIDNRINMLALVPSGLRALSLGLSQFSVSELDLRVVCCGGEVLSPELAREFVHQSHARLFNVYGPTETAILATAWECIDSDPSLNKNALPLGSPIDDSRIYILDQRNQLLPPGVSGEIAIGGITARGYLHDEKMTEEKFLSDTFFKQEVEQETDIKGQRYYKTGDNGYVDFNGQLYFKGRIDRQVKISGYRIEPGEIEVVLESSDCVAKAAVTLFEEQEKKSLYAFVELMKERSDSEKKTCLTDLSTLLLHSLPEYMQPRGIVALEKLPVLPNGKLDYSVLPAPTLNSSELLQTLPRSSLETHLMQCWEEVLDTHELSINDNFFDLGGDSLSAVKLIKKIESLVGHHCPLSFILEFSTIEQQAKTLSRELPLEAVPLLTTLSKNENLPAFYLAASGHGDAIRFSKLADELGEACSLHMLQPSGESVEHKTIEELARCYAELILIREEPPGYLGGFSIGGITALETARILTEQGKPPLGVLLLDTVFPHRLLKSPILYSLLRFISKLPIFNQIPINGRRLDTMLADPGIRTQLIALRKYQLSDYNDPVALFISSGLWGKGWFFFRWKTALNSEIKYYSLTGMHGGIFQKAHITVLSNAIRHYFKK